MPRAPKGERILGPYHEPGRRRWRVIAIAADGSKESSFFESEKAARQFARLLEADILSEAHTTESALDEYELHLRHVKGNKEQSIKQTLWAVRKIFPVAKPLWRLRERDVRSGYDSLVEGGASVATHRGCLAQTKTFLGWCVAQGWLADNPGAGIAGVGKRKRGKPQLTMREARRWYQAALELAESGDDGAVAALCACLLGLRASEIVSLRAGDVDEDLELGDTIHVRNAKTEAGDRPVAVPDALVPLLSLRARGKIASALIFPTREGRAHWRDWPRKQVQRICKDAGVRPVTAHSMRGLLATIALRRSVPGQAVQEALGHEDIRTTTGSYAQAGSAEEGARMAGLRRLSPAQSTEDSSESPDLGNVKKAKDSA